MAEARPPTEKPLSYAGALNMSIDQLIAYIECKNPAAIIVQADGQKYPAKAEGAANFVDGGSKPGKMDYILAAMRVGRRPTEVPVPLPVQVPAPAPAPAPAPVVPVREEPALPVRPVEPQQFIPFQPQQMMPEPPRVVVQEPLPPAPVPVRPREEAPPPPAIKIEPHPRPEEPLSQFHGGAFKAEAREYFGEDPEEFARQKKINVDALPDVRLTHPEWFK